MSGARYIVALDYDNCYTVDPRVFDDIIKRFEDAGVRVVIVTSRLKKNCPALPPWYEVHCTEGQAKQIYCELNDINISIWIDDDPQYILKDHEFRKRGV
jgi:hypothetical protein